MVKMYFLKLLIKIFVNIKKLFMAIFLSNRRHEKVMICYIIIRLDVQFVKKGPLEIVIRQQMKKRGMIKINNTFYIKLSIYLLLN